MPGGRGRFILTSEERKAIRRQKVRSYVQAHRQRKRELQANAHQAQEKNPLHRTPSDYESAQPRPERSFSNSFEAFSEFDPVKEVFPLPKPTLNDDAKFPINLPFTIRLGPKSTNSFLAVFPGEPSPLTPNGSNEGPRQVKVAIYFSYWATRFSYNVDAAQYEVLNDALVGLTLHLISMKKDDHELSVRALDLQTKSLRALRDGFDAYLKDDASSNANNPNNFCLLLSTAMVFSASELLVNKSWVNFSQHLSGVGALIEHAGPTCLNDISTQNNLFGYRSLNIAFQLLNRKSSFLSRPEWCYFPGRDKHKLGNHPFHTLLDIAYHVPGHMEAFDNAEERSLKWLKSEMQGLMRIEMQLDMWKSAVPETYSEEHIGSVQAEWEGVYEEAFEFCNPVAAVCFTLFAGVKVTVENLLIQVIEESRNHEHSPDRALKDKLDESLNWSRVVCQCLEYFFASDRRVVGNGFAIYAFAAAWENFTRLSVEYGYDMEKELDWCQKTANKLKEFEYIYLGKRLQVHKAQSGVEEVLRHQR